MTRVVARAQTRIDVLDQVVSCDMCSLSSNRSSGPVPFCGPTPSGIAVIGEAPSAEDAKKGSPFSDQAGVFRTALAEVGVRGAAYLNVISCVPKTEDALRPPTGLEISSCSSNLQAQLRLIDPKIIVLAGETALRVAVPRSTIAGAHGQFFKEAHRTMFPVFHPEAQMRNRYWKSVFMEDLEILRRFLDSGQVQEDLRCAWCGCAETEMEEMVIEPTGLAYCRTCV